MGIRQLPRTPVGGSKELTAPRATENTGKPKSLILHPADQRLAGKRPFPDSVPVSSWNQPDCLLVLRGLYQDVSQGCSVQSKLSRAPPPGLGLGASLGYIGDSMMISTRLQGKPKGNAASSTRNNMSISRNYNGNN